MSSGLIALLDDITALAKVAATSLDDAGAMAAKAGGKAAGIVIDDAAVTPRYVVGLCADREVPIIVKIAKGSLKNKLLILLPGALGLSLVAPWSITPLLMAGGAFLCLEGYHKVMHLVRPGHHEDKGDASTATTAEELEQERVSSAIRTDFILSAEIMAITLAAVSTSPLWMQAFVLAVVGLGMTLLVYGAVALIVKADDAGVALARFAHGAMKRPRIAVLLRAAAVEHGRQIRAAAEPGLRRHDEARVHVDGRHVGVPGVGDQRDAAGPEARVFGGAGNLCGEFRREGSEDGGGVDAGLLEDPALEDRHPPAAAGRAGMVSALPGGELRPAGRSGLGKEGAGAIVLQLFEGGEDAVLQFGKPAGGFGLAGLENVLRHVASKRGRWRRVKDASAEGPLP